MATLEGSPPERPAPRGAARFPAFARRRRAGTPGPPPVSAAPVPRQRREQRIADAGIRPVPATRPAPAAGSSRSGAPRLPERVRLVATAITAAGFAHVAGLAPQLIVPMAVVFWLVAGARLAQPRQLVLDTLVVAAPVLVAVGLLGSPLPFRGTVVLILLGALVLGGARYRERSGVRAEIGNAAQADALLIDLRDRLRSQFRPPVMPPGWQLETDLRSAHGGSFCGDFMVAACPDGCRLDVVLVDVSGNGRDAGARALLLTGAFSALLGALPYPEVLPAANGYLLEHGDEEGFATAVHASVDLRTGGFRLSGAGHPPAAQFHAGSGRWELLDGEQGPLLGVVAEAGYPRREGSLAAGDALLLYTDGLVEGRRLNLARGTDRLLGLADTVLTRGLGGGAALIAAGARSGSRDDRALVLLRRG